MKIMDYDTLIQLMYLVLRLNHFKYIFFCINVSYLIIIIKFHYMISEIFVLNKINVILLL